MRTLPYSGLRPISTCRWTSTSGATGRSSHPITRTVRNTRPTVVRQPQTRAHVVYEANPSSRTASPDGYHEVVDRPASHSGNRPPTLIFDGDCGICTWAANFSRRRLPTGVRVVPCQLVDDPSSVGLTRETIAEAVWWVDAHEHLYRGHRAFVEAARAFGGVWWILGSFGRARALDRLGARMYSVLARNRFRLPGSTPACQVPASAETRRRTS